jgi:hypothetical protein
MRQPLQRIRESSGAWVDRLSKGFGWCVVGLVVLLYIVLIHVWHSLRARLGRNHVSHQLDTSLRHRAPTLGPALVTGRLGLLSSSWLHPRDVGFGWSRPSLAAPCRESAVTAGLATISTARVYAWQAKTPFVLFPKLGPKWILQVQCQEVVVGQKVIPVRGKQPSRIVGRAREQATQARK